MNFNQIKIGTAIILMFLFLAGTAQATITGATIVTNLSSSDRVLMGTNSTFNFSFTESVGTNNTNFTFPSSFNFTGFLQENITNNTGSSITVGLSSTMVNLSYTARASGVHYFNFTSNVQAPAASGTYTINITTNASTTPTSVKLCARDPTYPYFVSANNSVFTTTCGTPTETFGTATTSLTLSGSGVANLTFYAPNITGQTNITVGYGATNASYITTRYTSGTTPNNTIYVVTNGSVTNPIITISSVSELQSSNLPYAVATGGAITFAALYYILRRRRH